MYSFLKDVGYSLRALRRRPALLAAILATLAVGIGANAAIFSIVNAVPALGGRHVGVAL
jgi:hypothetical protein